MTESQNDNDRTALIKKVDRKFDGFLKLDEVLLSHPRYDGGRQTIKRLSVERGDSVAVLLVNPELRIVWLVEQFRYSTLRQGPGWLVEVVAGTIGKGEAPEDAARREVLEETGIEGFGAFERIGTFYVSPGMTSERIHLFYAAVDTRNANWNTATQLRDYEEDIKIFEFSLDDFMAQARLCRLDDAKTLIAGLWLCAHNDRLNL
jgi:nudix-type nucleoside diphosphatase (YffH/AdpP family)